ncbi:MAG: DNA repair protein RecO [Deltaproteobacteria bacterium]|nr:DNA repair protein RecO [Deltaproteobacteria bacterium]
MERFSDRAIILKTYPYQERDRIAVCLTEHKGRITGVAKGAIHSRRYGGSLDLLTCSNLDFVQKPNAEMARIDAAVTQHEFQNLHKDFDRLTAASFAAEFCLRLIEPHEPAREMFIILSNTLFQIDAGMPLQLAVNAFLCKAFKSMGYPPSLLRCVQCARGAHEVIEAYAGQHEGHSGLFFWYSEAGGMVCWQCGNARLKVGLEAETLLHFQRLTSTPFKELSYESDGAGAATQNAQLYRMLSDFLFHHIPGLPAGGLKTWKLLNDSLVLPELLASGELVAQPDGEFDRLS